MGDVWNMLCVVSDVLIALILPEASLTGVEVGICDLPALGQVS